MPFCSVAGQRLAGDLLLVEQLVALLGHQQLVALGDGELLALDLGAERLAEHLAEIDHAHLRAGHARDVEGRHAGGAALLHVDLDRPVGQRAVAQAAAELVAGLLAGRGADQRVEHALLGVELGLGRDLLAQPVAGELERDLDQVAHDALDVAADIADLGELGRLDLEERRLGEPGQAAGDLGLAAAGGADHQDVLGQHLVAQRCRRAAGGASDCAGRWRRRAWPRPGRR